MNSVSKILGHISRLSSLLHKEEKFQTNICPEISVFFSLIGKLQ